MTRTELQAQIADVVSQAEALIEAVDDGTISSAALYEGAANPVRTQIAELIPLVSAEWGVDSYPTIRALKTLAAALVDLRSAVVDATATLTVTVDRETSLIELAVERYQDFSRWTELAELNPDLPHPGSISPGTAVVVMHAR